VCAPAAALAAVRPFAGDGAQGVFRADLAGLAVAAALGGALPSASWRAAAVPAIAALLAGVVHALAAGSWAGAPGLALLVLGVALSAAGLAHLGRLCGAPSDAAALVAAGVPWAAMAGLFWADDVAARLSAAARFPLRQAVLHADPATAAAYGAGFDRLRDSRVYDTVPLATSMVEPPDAVATGLLWVAFGAAAWAAARGLATLRAAGARRWAASS
jgi:hypothetical protein